jgi:hypothetical protein
MEWPFRRFVKMFDAYQRRTICDRWEARRAAHIAALWANTDLNDEKNDRPGIIDRLEHSYDALTARIWNGEDSETDQAEEESWNDDFIRRGSHASRAVKIRTPSLPGEEVIASLPA